MRVAGIALVLLLVPVAAVAAEVKGTVTIDGTRVADAVVYLEGGGSVDDLPPVTMDQKNLSFVPHVLPVRRGTRIEFTNSDAVQHNIFSPSTPGRFNLGTHSRGETASVTLNEPGDVVVLCNIHMEMEAHILVLDGAHFALTDSQGNYRIPDVPPGAYSARIWQRSWLGTPSAVEVGEGALTLDLDVKR